ncbi:hypothetical protein PG996_012673 [Apiospora saccharicola]|uniref:Uncharacterized protein n=1 Tax=Apiospora saccharicola TaxID=335842 RepID=A0ABR1U389_9PEZI
MLVVLLTSMLTPTELQHASPGLKSASGSPSSSQNMVTVPSPSGSQSAEGLFGKLDSGVNIWVWACGTADREE